MPTPTYDLISSSILGSSTTTVSFTSLPSTYRDLRLVIQGKATASSYYAFLRFNNDSSSTYRGMWMYGDGNNRAGNGAADNKFQLGAQNSYWDSSNEVMVTIDMLDYRGSTKNRTILSRFSKGTGYVELFTGQILNTATATSVQITMNVGQFAAGSTFYLYGIVS